EILPPEFALPVDRPLARDRNIVGTVREDTVLKSTARSLLEIRWIVADQERGALFDAKLHVAQEHDRPGEPAPRRHDHHTPTGLTARLDCALDRGRATGRPIPHSAVFVDRKLLLRNLGLRHGRLGECRRYDEQDRKPSHRTPAFHLGYSFSSR